MQTESSQDTTMCNSSRFELEKCSAELVISITYAIAILTFVIVEETHYLFLHLIFDILKTYVWQNLR